MKIIKQEVKTTFNIEIGVADFLKVISKFLSSEAMQAVYPNAWSGIDIHVDLTEDNVLWIMRETARYGNGDTYSVIARLLGFDGWSNAMRSSKKGGFFEMSVYIHGDAINSGEGI